MSKLIPQHIAFIMDGNGRWAEAKGWQRLEGHKQGIETVKVVLEESLKRQIPTVSFYAFSSENWRRPEAEVRGLFTLMRHYFKQEMNKLNEQNIRVKFIGNRAPGGKLDGDIIALMNDVEEKTAGNTAITAYFAINYGARNELTRAAAELAQFEAEKNQLSYYHGEALGQFLDTGAAPDVDLMVRTGGEQRLSNFLLWQLAYAELCFTPTHWPDFDAKAYQVVLDDFARRQRRFGGLPDSTEQPAQVGDDVDEI